MKKILVGLLLVVGIGLSDTVHYDIIEEEEAPSIKVNHPSETR